MSSSKVDLDRIKNLLRHLETLDEGRLRDLHYEEFKNYFHDELENSRMTYFKRNPGYLFRGRRNEVGEMFERKSQISYVKDRLAIKKLGRANEINQSVFYCSTDEYLAIMESSLLYRDPKYKADEELITVGVWAHKRLLNLINLPFGEKEKDFALIDARKEFEAQLCKMNSEEANFIREFFIFISNDFEKTVQDGSEHEYKISACYSNFVFDQKFNLIANPNEFVTDGILYPSVKWLDSKKLTESSNDKTIKANIVLKTETVDDCIELLEVHLWKIIRRQGEEFDVRVIMVDRDCDDNRIVYQSYS